MMREGRRRHNESFPLLPVVLSIVLMVGGCASLTETGTDNSRGAKPEATADFELESLAFPTDLAFAPDGTLFFTEKSGALRVARDGVLEADPVAKFPVPRISGYHETGLLGLALSPNYAENRLIYVYHTYRDGSKLTNRIVRLNTKQPGSRQVIFDDILGERIHVGGKLRFGPDGKLYVATGEANKPKLSRDRESPNGKILRLNPDGSIPEDNPFNDSPAFAIGLRNVFGMAFDDRGRLVVTENGPQGADEINLIRRGADYGWPTVTGSGDGRFSDPLVTFRQAIAPTGIVFYVGGSLPKLSGDYIFGDWNGGRLHSLTLNDGKATTKVILDLGEGITALAVSPKGSLYVATESAIRPIKPAEL